MTPDDHTLINSMTSIEIQAPPETSIGRQFADFLSKQGGQIILDWTAAVHKDRMITSSEDLTHRQLIDHVPQLLDDLNHTLCNAFSEDVKQQASWTAAIHGQMRWKEGYDISELLREMRDLRLVLIPYVIEFQEQHPEAGGAKNLFAMNVLHGFLDDSMRTSVEQFLTTGEHIQHNNQRNQSQESKQPVHNST